MNPALRFKDDNGNDYPDWEEKNVEDVCHIQTGKSNTQDKVSDGTYPFYVRSPFVERSNRYLYDCEAVLTVGDGVGTGKVYHYVNGKFDCHQRVYVMSNFKQITGKFFYYFFSSSFEKRVHSMTAKTSVDSVRREMIAKMVVNLPSLPEQQKIASFLSSIDEKITLTDRQLELMKQYKQGVLQQIFSQEIRFKDDNGNDYPDWKEKKLNEITTKITDGSISALKRRMVVILCHQLRI